MLSYTLHMNGLCSHDYQCHLLAYIRVIGMIIIR